MKEKNRVRIAIAGAAAGIILGMKYLFPVLLPFLIGWILAEAVNPAASRIAGTKTGKKLHLSKSCVGTALILFFTVLLIWGLLWGVQSLSEKLADCIQHFPEIRRETMVMIERCCTGVEHVTGIPAEESADYVYRQMANAGEYLLEEGKGMDTAVASVKWCAVAAGAAFIGVVSGILFLQEREKVLAWLEKKSSFQKGRKLLKGLGKDIKEYLKAQVKILAVICAVCAAGLWLLDIRGAVGYGILIGLLDALPILGTGTFLVPMGIFWLLQGETLRGAGLFLLYLVTACIRQFLEPRLVGKQLGISPLLVLLSVYLGFFLYGGWGFLLGPLSALLLYGIVKEYKPDSF